jgi:ketose-bisphosphate aldolase
MAIVNPLPFIKKAKEIKAAIPAFNIHTLEMLQAVVEAASETNSPVIIQTSKSTINHIGLPFIVSNVEIASREHNVPVALHLDHCTDYNTVIKCIKEGYSSVMVDGSMLDYKENVSFVREVVKVAQAVDVAVEGEIGKIQGTEDAISVDSNNDNLTLPEEAKRFAEDTGLDTLAVAIGTAHGVYQGEPKLDFRRLENIEKEVSVPLVLHGASGVSEKDLKETIKRGITKVNIATDLKVPMAEAIKNFFKENPDGYDPRKYLGQGKAVVKEVIKQKIKICGVHGLLDKLEV